MALLLPLVAWADPARTEGKDATLRIATFNVDLTRRGPGLLLRDLQRGDAQADALAALIAHVAPDVLLLTKFDHDHDMVALGAFSRMLALHDHPMEHRLALRPNTGWRTGRDMTGDGRSTTPDDTQGYGAFAGVAGMALLSRLPIVHDQVRDFSAFLWRDLPDAQLPRTDRGLFPDPEVFDLQRLSSVGHWDVPVLLPGGQHLRLLAFHAGPPVFGGRHDRNLNRNHDEVMFWVHYLDGALPFAPPDRAFVVLGDANLDPQDGDGRHAAIRALLAHPGLQDPRPASSGAAAHPGGPRRGDRRHDTVAWARDPGPGALRVDYVLPSADLTVRGAGVFWPLPGAPEHALLAPDGVEPTRHRLVWVDVAPPPP